jgi:hypothetical protein
MWNSSEETENNTIDGSTTRESEEDGGRNEMRLEVRHGEDESRGGRPWHLYHHSDSPQRKRCIPPCIPSIYPRQGS